MDSWKPRTPWEPEENVTSQQHLEIDGEELDEQETGETNESEKHGRSVTVSLRRPSGDLETQDLTNLTTDRETGLPFRFNLPSTAVGRVRIENTVPGRKRLVGKELTEQHGIVTFHDNGTVHTISI